MSLMTDIIQPAKKSSFLNFIWQFIRNPKSVGAIAPSGAVLSRKMATGLDANSRVLELGGGTGTLTRGIANAGVTGSNLTVIEMNPDFIRSLTEQFPGARIVDHSAFEIETLPAEVCDLNAVVSGLPLVNMSRDNHRAIMRGAFSRLKPGGCYRQFTYRPRCPIGPDVLEEFGLKATYEAMALRNLPPAFVYRIERT
ncbi:class I SAM-dependent methyltransferase [Candidatus Phaeomarinobacter ectocarpi]|nr:methyltransferase domain-containing protein [Candidatus Phaeomarinobacter ectocarpi]